MGCPLREEKRGCRDCRYGKEGLCDWPYARGMSRGEIREITRRLAAKRLSGPPAQAERRPGA